MKKTWIITKWCKSITDNGKDLYINTDIDRKDMQFKFRLLDDDGIVYAYGISSEINFSPLKHYREIYGVEKIEYKNRITGKYEVL